MALGLWNGTMKKDLFRSLSKARGPSASIGTAPPADLPPKPPVLRLLVSIGILSISIASILIRLAGARVT